MDFIEVDGVVDSFWKLPINWTAWKAGITFAQVCQLGGTSRGHRIHIALGSERIFTANQIIMPDQGQHTIVKSVTRGNAGLRTTPCTVVAKRQSFFGKSSMTTEDSQTLTSMPSPSCAGVRHGKVSAIPAQTHLNR